MSKTIKSENRYDKPNKHNGKIMKDRPFNVLK